MQKRGYGFVALLILLCAMVALTATVTDWDFLMAATYDVSIERRDYYAVSLAQTADIDEARQAAAYAKTRGGAGYIALFDSYQVFASVYTTSSAAQTVADRIEGAAVYPISTPRLRLNLGYENERRARLNSALQYLSTLPDKMTVLADGLDNGDISFDAARATVLEYCGALNDHIASVLLITALPDLKITAVSATLGGICDTLTPMYALDFAEESASAGFRYAALRSIFATTELFTGLQKTA